jgi:hypothetical protein
MKKVLNTLPKKVIKNNNKELLQKKAPDSKETSTSLSFEVQRLIKLEVVEQLNREKTKLKALFGDVFVFALNVIFRISLVIIPIWLHSHWKI